MPSGIPVTGASDEFFFRLSQIPRRGMECDLLASNADGHPPAEETQGSPLKPQEGGILAKEKLPCSSAADGKRTPEVFRQGKTERADSGAYLRHLVNGVIPRDAPPPEFHVFMRELYRWAII